MSNIAKKTGWGGKRDNGGRKTAIIAGGSKVTLTLPAAAENVLLKRFADLKIQDAIRAALLEWSAEQ